MNEYGFIPFCLRDNERIFNSIILASTHIPPKMNQPDYRFNINNIFCHSLSKEFSLGGEGGTIRSSYSEGYDMVFGDKTKISVKIQQEIFQRDKNGKMLKPKPITMKNCQGENTENKMILDLDFLLAIQRGKFENGRILVGFGVISFEKLRSLLFRGKGEQIKAKILNSEYDYFSGLREISIVSNPDRDSELNKRFSEGLARTYNDIFGV